MSAILFDFDGVIMDTHELHYVTWKEVFWSLWISLDKERYVAQLSGSSRERIIKKILGEDITDEKIKEISLLKEKSTDLVIAEWYQFTLLEWVAEFIDYLTSKSIPYGIGSAGVSARKFIHHWWYEKLFPIVISGDQVTHKKPDPEVFLTLADRLSCPYKDCIVIEDSRVGIEGVHAAGMQSVWLTHTWEINNDIDVDLLLHDMTSYKQIIKHFSL